MQVCEHGQGAEGAGTNAERSAEKSTSLAADLSCGIDTAELRGGQVNWKAHAHALRRPRPRSSRAQVTVGKLQLRVSSFQLLPCSLSLLPNISIKEGARL